MSEDASSVAEPREDVCEDSVDVTWDTFAQGFFVSRCQACHAKDTPNRREAPNDVFFDEEDDALVWSDRVRARVLDEGSMPPGGGITDDERALLDAWLKCSE